jgi:uncharacterized repeat protein (TIGR03803 family)
MYPNSAFWWRSMAIALFLTLFTPFSFSQTLTVLHKFHSSDGRTPAGGLIHGSDGYLYGTTDFGGNRGCGTVFKISLSGNFKSIYSFAGGSDGCKPARSLIRDAAGNIYGTTEAGGPSNYGTVFKIDSTGHESVLYAFTGNSDGAYPDNDLIRDKSGNLYGTTISGGDGGCGTLFKINTKGKESVVYPFAGDGAHACNPAGGPVMDSSGNLYGAAQGGAYFSGYIFKIDAAGKFTDLLDFGGPVFPSTNGNDPASDLTFGPAGILYGTTSYGGDLSCSSDGCGTVFEFSNGVETVLHAFGRPPADVSTVSGPLIRDSTGNLYGTASGGTVNSGGIYKVDASGNETVLYSFTGGTDGGTPWGRLYVSSSGSVFGTTLFGGDSNNDGVVFKITP